MNIKHDDVAVIGMSGKFPGANSVSEFWENICAKKESIRSLSDEELRKAGVSERDIADNTYVKASAMLDDIDMFDPGFFKISPLEAELMDPQVRLLLQCAWETLEDAGYVRKEAQNIGVFAGAGGVTTNYFSSFVNVNDRFEKITASPTHLGNDKDFLATYLSYKLNLTGPSVTVQTACSTSLVALHQARLSLLSGECDMALAGGVSVRVPHGQGYHYKEGYIFSRSGHVKTFDESADGVVFGSGLGLVLIKKLSAAIRDGDNIYAIIKGSAISNDGKGKMSYAASSARGQIACARAALKNAGIEAGSIGFVESHGTGTSMGDPEEVKALSAVFKEQTDKKAYCALGAVKTNVGHLEAAAGIVSFIKAVLAVKHGLIPPTAHYAKPNPRIKFENTPFYITGELQKWNQDKQPRRAAVNSLGVGGTNAFVILEEYGPARASRKKAPSVPVVVPLSAKSEAGLLAYAKRLTDFLTDRIEKKEAIDIVDVAYTLQTGREAMDRRVAFVVSTAEELKAALKRYLQDGKGALPQGDAADLAAAWVGNGDVDWSALYADGMPRRISLPTYVFAKERYWIETGGLAPSRAILHPLLHTNTSDLNEQKYSSIFTGDEFFLRDHQIRTWQYADSGAHVQKVLPGVAYLEMARVAIEQAAPIRYAASVPELRDIVWLEPIAVTGEKQVNIALVAKDEEGRPDQPIDFEIYTEDDHIHCQGCCLFSGKSALDRIDTAALKAAMVRCQWSAHTLYAALAQMGLNYGPTHRTIVAIECGDRELLATLELQPVAEANQPDYVLHPGLMDGALQAATALLFDADSIPGQPIVPFALESLRVLATCADKMLAWARYSQGSGPQDKSAKLDVDLFDAEGNICVQIRGFMPRVLGKETLGSLLATQVWQPGNPAAAKTAHAEQHVLLCDLPQVDGSKIARNCSRLQLDAAKDVAERYSRLALACFEKAQVLIKRKPQSKVQVQVVLPNTEEHAVYAGLSGLMKTMRLENPQVAGQIVLVDGGIDTEGLASLLSAECGHFHDPLVRYEDGVRYTAHWSFVADDGPAAFDADSPFKDQGVYLITGGLGGLGVLFAKEILGRTANAKIILTGRATLAEMKKSAKRKAILESLQVGGHTVEYWQLDLDDPEQVNEAIAAIADKHGRLNGIIHSAGMMADGFILKKTSDDFRRVLAPKVLGTYNLDRATQDIDLDFLVLFSSLSSAVGNFGQADYAAANGFLDEFAAYRNRLAKTGKRRGATLAIRWPLWREGGMQPDAAGKDMLHETTGIYPMQTATGMRMFYRSLSSGYDQTLVMEGELHQMQRALGCGTMIHATTPAVDTPQFEVTSDASGDLTELSEAYLCKQFSALLKLPTHKVDARASLEDYGIDSILALDLTRMLEKTFGSLPKTLFFEYLTIHDLAVYFAKFHGARLSRLFCSVDGSRNPTAESLPARPESVSSRRSGCRRFIDAGRTGVSRKATVTDPIAIVGLSGRYPEARNADEFWINLRDGKDCIVEIPKDRWDWRDYYNEDRAANGCHFSKWGGFIEGVDEFDARFFNISPVEAETIDPQERLFLQHAWIAVEDAGYTRAALQIPKENDLPAQVGVYAGVMYGEYQLLGAEASLQGERMGFASNPASIANRVSYFLNLHGPSMVVDTMCSSSLTAIHLACQDLKLGRTSLGIAGGVNVTIHPNKYLMLSAGQFIAGDGHCQSFGEGGDGYIPGEGVGVVVLKRLSEAQRDGNHIYGIIRGSGLSHGGKTNGYTVPNPMAQASAIRQALAEAEVDPRHISYIEAHGTGTKLGDPIEIAALSNVFRESTGDNQFCLIGSAKSNIGHCEAAAGIAGLTKVLLQFKHRQIAPSLHSSRLNPHIDFGCSPFVVNQTLKPWDQPIIDGRKLPRLAGISSFGAGGSNAHVVVEEYPNTVTLAHPAAGVEFIFVLSARTAEQLRQKASDLIDFLEGQSELLSLSSLAYTLQVGREAMDKRLAVLAGSLMVLKDKLRTYLDGQPVDGVFQGQVKAHKDSISLFAQDADLRATLDKWIADRKYAKLADFWVKGLDLGWRKFHAAQPQLISLPGYPFARQRYWIDVPDVARRSPKALATPVLYPLLHRNTSDFSQQSYTSVFAGNELFLVGEPGRKWLSEAACLEMARAAIEMSMPAQQEASILELRDVAWAQPGVAIADRQVTIALFDKHDRQAKFEIYSSASGDSEIVHCQGLAGYSHRAAPARLDLAAIGSQALTELDPPAALQDDQNDYLLHPALLQGVLQTAAGLTGGWPQTMAALRIVFPFTQPKFAWVRLPAFALASGERPIDIDLCDEQGNVCVQLHGLRCLSEASQIVEKPEASRLVEAPQPVALGDSHVSAPAAQPTRVHFNAALSPVAHGSILAKPNRGIALQAPSAALVIGAVPAKASRIRFDAPSAGVPNSVVLDSPLLAGSIAGKPKSSIVLTEPSVLPGVSAGAGALAKPRIFLSTSVGGMVQENLDDLATVSLFDHGNGVFALHIGGPAGRNALSANVVADLLGALRTVEGAPSAKVLTIEGSDAHFLTGGLRQHNDAVAAKFYRALVEFPYPVIAVVVGDAIGAGFLAASVCDFMVCSETARYAFALPEEGLYPSAAEAVFRERFGSLAATDFLYLSTGATGTELKTKGWTCPILPRNQVVAYARDLAANLAKKTRLSLRLLKQHLAQPIADAVHALTVTESASPTTESTEADTIGTPSKRIRLEAHGERVLVATIHGQAKGITAKNVLADLETILGQMGTSPYRCLVFASELPGFLPEAGDKARFHLARAFGRALLTANRPVVVALNADATGTAWYVAQFADACVHSERGRYSCTDVLDDSERAAEAAAAFSLRFGDESAREILLAGGECSGAGLRDNYGAIHVFSPEQVIPGALKLADALAAFPAPVLAAWKKQTASVLQEAIDQALPETGADAAPAVAASNVPATLDSKVISAIVHPEGILEVRMADREAKNMFSEDLSRGMQEIFAHVEESRAYKVVILTGYDNYFSSGGTRDTLLAIHGGKARFTDNKVFQLPLSCPVPVIAAMQGHGIGAGWAMGMYADFVLFSDESRYFSPYMGYGFTPGAGSTLIFPKKIGYDLARETLLTAREYAGGELKERGLRNPVLPREEVVPAAIALARRIAMGGRARLVALKGRWAKGLKEALQDTFDRELTMHERTFVGQTDTVARIQERFGAETAVIPQTVAAPAAPAALSAHLDDLDDITASLRKMLAHELRMQENEIGDDEQFVDLGLDSITGVTWIRCINETYGTDIEAIKVYSYPTLSQLACHVQSEIPKVTASAVAVAVPPAATVATPVADVAAVAVQLKTLLAHELRMRENEIDDDEQFVDLGLDSITGVTWIRRINEIFGTDIEAIKVYSYPTLAQLSRYVREEAVKAGTLVAAAATEQAAQALIPRAALATALTSWRRKNQSKALTGQAGDRRLQPIAVIGMAGQFPKARNLEEFWQNIVQGRDCVEEIPGFRWDVDLYFQAGETVPGKTYSKWMGALEEYDLFDAAFFNISPREARSMDPQQRLFLQECWHSIEHAGYNPRSLSGSRCGVFVGVSGGDYHQISRQEQVSGQGFTGGSVSILAARISYFLDLHGPCLSIETACSSSLVAIATACDSLVCGGSDLALAGGVNVMSGPGMQIMTAQVGMLSPQGRCFTFDARADGIANGEGVGVVMLKRLEDAERDGDWIYGVVEGWGVNQDGKTNGITAPNADSQTRLQQEVYDRFGIDPAHIQLIEAHGTGTALGDPIEVAGLKAAFGKYTRKKDYCALGSVKSNIGHCLTAAGISAFLKVLLALKHRQLPPTIHFSKLNPHIVLQDSPFYINDRLREWQQNGSQPRRAGVNSFGFGGTNAHVVVAEYRDRKTIAVDREPAIIPLSARTAERLKQQVGNLLEFLRLRPGCDLRRMAYTLQAGREAMNERAAFVATSVADLQNKLQAYMDREEDVLQTESIYRGQVSGNKDTLQVLGSDPDFQTLIGKWIARKELPRLADLWVKGLAVDWNSFYEVGGLPQRMGLPTYPFAKERYWIEAEPDEAMAASSSAIGSMQVVAACDEEMYAWVRPSAADGQKADIDLYDREGNVCVQFKGLALKLQKAMAGCFEGIKEIDVAPAVAQLAAPVSQPSVSLEHLQRELKTSLAEALFMQPADVDVNKSFTELGLDSIIGVEWVKTINKACGTNISATRVYDYPSVTELAGFLYGEIAMAVMDGPEIEILEADELPVAAAAGAVLDTLQRELQTSLAEALFMQPADVDANKSFTELGLDSIIGVEWVKTINKAYGTNITATCVYDYPNVKELAAYLQAEIGSAASFAQAAVSASPVIATVVPMAPPRPHPVPTVSLDVLQQALRASLAEALFMKPADVDMNKSFTELGLDSIIGVEWVKTINKTHSTSISATRVYDYPSIKELAAFLIGELTPTEPPPSTPPASHASIAASVPALRPKAQVVAMAAQTPEAKPAFAAKFFPFTKLGSIRFEAKYGKQFRDLYFHCGEGEGDFEAEGEFSVRCAINLENNVCLKEHVVFGEHLLPTDAYIELVYAVYRSYFSPADVCLKNIAIVNPIVGVKGRDTHIKVIFRRAGGDLLFFVKSSPAVDFRNDRLHMQGFVSRTEGLSASRFDDAFAIDKEIAGAQIPTNSGIYYTPLQTLRFGESSALGLIHVADHDFSFLANPFVLYGGLCTVINYGAYLTSRHYGPSDDQFLPYRIGRITVLGSLTGADYRCYAEVQKIERDEVKFYFEIVDGARQPVLVVESIALRRVARKAIQQQAQSAKSLPVIADQRASTVAAAAEKVAIIGMSCRYAMSENVDAFWNNLKAGRDCVTEVPAERWSRYHDWYHPDPRHLHTSYSKWGGFLDRIDTFDALFFGISPAEAELIEPQQRIFLEEAWKTIESAGYAPGALSNLACGVYVGCSMSDYGRVLTSEGEHTAGAAFMGTSSAILSGRIAYYLNLKGPALAVDTACSSSLVAVHLACESIRSGENQMALAGGVNVLATPLGHILTSQVGMPSRDGRCAAFDASANGIVFSEGCGVLLLKALSLAEKDKDNILGVIQASGINQDGKTNGITAPSSRAQEQLISQVYGKFGIDPRRIGYAEAHGTATPLGDPIEVNALTSVFGKYTQEKNFCALGSVKSNIGHAGFAAGVASMVKVLLCMKHRKLVPSIHYNQPNPHIAFERSPFYVNTQYRDWVSEGPRLATVSSFGFSGTNAHIVIEEHVAASGSLSSSISTAPDGKVLVPLSAKAVEQLEQKVRDLLGFLRNQEQPADLVRLAYTLQTGRDAMEHRLAFVVDSVEQLAEKLQDCFDRKTPISEVYRGQVMRGDDTLTAFVGDADMRQIIGRWIAQKSLSKIADLWVRGYELDWNWLYDGVRLQPMVLPTYPFAKERCWVDGAGASKPAASGNGLAVLHPLLHRNTSDLSCQSYGSTFAGDEFFLAGHRINGQPVLPAVAYLEMARAALEDALPAEKASRHLELRHIVWAQPLVVTEEANIAIAVSSENGEKVEFEVYSRGDEDADETLYCQGSCVVAGQPEQPELDLDSLRTQMCRGSVDGADLYTKFATMGLNYGPAYKGIVTIHQGEDQLLVDLSLPEAARQGGGNYVLHPSLMDSALQGSITLIDDFVSITGKPSLPFALESLQVFSACTERMVAWVRYSAGGRSPTSSLIKVDIDLCDLDGKVCVQMLGFSSRSSESAAAFDEARYQSIIAGILDNEFSVDDAVELG